MYRGKKLDLVSFKQLEEELLNLGNEVNRINKAFDEKDLDKAGIVYIKRSRWLNEIFRELTDLYNKVDEKTKYIMTLLYIDNKKIEEVSKQTGKGIKSVRNIHNLIVNAIAEKIGMIDIGESIMKESSRYLTAETKRKVNKRYKGKCAVCDSDENIHYHHIHYFSEGGSNDAGNIMILCAGCHAKEHSGERAYYALKAMAEG